MKKQRKNYRLMRLPEATSSLKKIIHLPNYILLKSISIIELCCRLDNAKTYTCFKATLGQYHINTVDHKFENINQRVYFETLNHLHQEMHQHGCSGCTTLQNFGTSPFAPAEFEVFSTIETCRFEAQSSLLYNRLHPQIQIPNACPVRCTQR